jgi:thiol-disulfide isomerase/thioredoxin
MKFHYLLIFALIFNTFAYSSDFTQQEGLCGPDTETVTECTDPSLETGAAASPVQEERKKSRKVSPSEAERSTSHPINTQAKEGIPPATNQGTVTPSAVNTSPQDREFVVHFFWGSGCPHCKEEKVFLNEMKKTYPKMQVLDYEVWYEKENAALLSRMAHAYDIRTAGVPVTFIGNSSVIGFSDHSKKELSELFLECTTRQCPDPADFIAINSRIVKDAPVPGKSTTGDLECTDKGKVVYIPWIGNLDSSQMSLPVITVVIAGLDSFNPCAFFVLFSLLGLLIHAKSRRKMFLIGSVFVFFSGFIYFLFMAAWLNLFLVMGQVDIITKLAGFVAIVIALINIKDFFIFKKGVSLTIPDHAKPKLFDRMRKLLKSSSVVSILIGTAVLAVAANAYELLCTAGFPMVYTRILTLNNLSSAWYYFYLILYNMVYIIPLSIIVILFTVTLGKKQLTERQGRLLKLVSGTMMLALGGVLLVNPTVLSNAFISFLLLIGALIVSFSVSLITDKINSS